MIYFKENIYSFIFSKCFILVRVEVNRSIWCLSQEHWVQVGHTCCMELQSIAGHHVTHTFTVGSKSTNWHIFGVRKRMVCLKQEMCYHSWIGMAEDSADQSYGGLWRAIVFYCIRRWSRGAGNGHRPNVIAVSASAKLCRTV